MLHCKVFITTEAAILMIYTRTNTQVHQLFRFAVVLFTLFSFSGCISLGQTPENPAQCEQPSLSVSNQLQSDYALLYLIDKSGSSEELVNAAAIAVCQSISLLPGNGLISLMGFDHEPFVIISFNTQSAVSRLCKDKLSRVMSRGKSNILPSLEEARRQFAKVATNRKHIFLVSDGKIPATQRRAAFEINQLRCNHITLSAILTPDGDKEIMQLLANKLDGSLYKLDSLSDLSAAAQKDAESFLDRPKSAKNLRPLSQ